VGLLLDHTGVCESYAKAYELLSDQAGIDSVVVFGNAPTPHAWNKTYMNGKWQVVDTTWDDDPNPPPHTELFGITDAQAQQQWEHVEDTDGTDPWMIGSMIATYAAN
jgi:hypothetical protein